MKTRKFCPHCGRPVLKSCTKEYAFQCFVCGEDFYRFEVYTTKHIDIVRRKRKECYLWNIAVGCHVIPSLKKALFLKTPVFKITRR